MRQILKIVIFTACILISNNTMYAQGNSGKANGKAKKELKQAKEKGDKVEKELKEKQKKVKKEKALKEKKIKDNAEKVKQEKENKTKTLKEKKDKALKMQKGNAFGRNKNGLTGREFGQARAADARAKTDREIEDLNERERTAKRSRSKIGVIRRRKE